MKIIQVKRKSKVEKRYTKRMGQLAAKVTYVKKYVLGIPVKTLYKYRQTYYGEIKDCKDCHLFV
ncbi:MULTISPECIES: hypothetical protein [Cellulophaga]|uniref:Transposase n=1 Tax=Cellulophaga geojensis KL-A TaxID=1328323 RepID=A0ABN0RPM6_9FLAO|nr:MULTISPECIES: hypothetical protein [Cellulophaga]AIM60476.1 hypothetical protein IX49_08040 [Cellulophaga lytica]APU10350.1 hypothetical protein A5M85_08660 [Cellulophaga lytica]EWH13841.1 hypothetical protein KLA_07312 [Cellulophaga geojensis KL-A]MDO6852254.1 hypothetical protein [Cellulophaga lytica]TVZ07988.1 hypothetical protein JM80_0468 [Cellulophaga sp. RHA_52]